MKERLDILLVERGLFASREKAKAAIMAGIVYIDEVRVDKAGTQVDTEANIIIRGNTCPYVSRGGLKLAKSINEFALDLKDAICMDMGASTGGFTDCMLQNGAKKVYAIDVGYGQLDYKLRTDERVVNLEKTNIRYLDNSLIKEEIDFISIDVSFISLALMFPKAKELLKKDGKIICLIKPQFEAGKEQVGKNGIVRDKNVHIQTIKNVISYANDNGLLSKGLTFSPVTGAKGNIEYLLYLENTDSVAIKQTDVSIDLTDEKIKEIVEKSHLTLDK